MEITRNARGESFELKLKGRMDATWSDHVAHALEECVRAGEHNLVLDMAQVDYISSAGLRVLVLYARQLSAIQGHIGVSNPSSNVRKVLELSGLESLLSVSAGPAGTSTPAPTVAYSQAAVALAKLGVTAEIFELDPQATLWVEWPGDPATWLAGHARPEAGATVEFATDRIGVGLGALVSGEEATLPAFGEFLAAAGAAVVQPADGSNKPDYLLQQEALTPTLRVAYGMVGVGRFRRLLRFDKGAQQASLPLSTLLRAALQAVGSDAVGLVIVAETAALIGASLQQVPGPTQDIFGFPQVRDWLSLTAEAAFANSTSLIAGFAAHGPGSAPPSSVPRLRLLKPLDPAGDLYGHLHAAALPYCPLRKGKLELGETIHHLFECERVLGVLHLVNDWRELSGAGESRLLRGACWCAPLTF